jgi:2-haloalkanoic acid dehalogenase type II
VKALTFDGWGTLVDWQAGAQAFVAGLLARPHTSSVARPSLEEWMARWLRIRRQMLKPYRPWRELLGRSYDAAMQFFGMEAFVDDGPALVRHLAMLEPRPDARASLRKLARKYRLAIVSDADRETLSEVMGRIQAPFSSVVTAEDVKVYKPDGRIFALALERLGLAPSEVMHVATLVEEDIQPARAAGMKTAMVGEGEADVVVRSLEELAHTV